MIELKFFFFTTTVVPLNPEENKHLSGDD